MEKTLNGTKRKMEKTRNGTKRRKWKTLKIKNLDIVEWKKHGMGKNVKWKTYIEH
jgi:hypothetical protein